MEGQLWLQPHPQDVLDSVSGLSEDDEISGIFLERAGFFLLVKTAMRFDFIRISKSFPKMKPPCLQCDTSDLQPPSADHEFVGALRSSGDACRMDLRH